MLPQNPMYVDMLRVFAKAELEGGSLFSKLMVVGNSASKVYGLKGIAEKSYGLGKALNYAGTHGFDSIVSKKGYDLASGAVKTVASSGAMHGSSSPIMSVIQTLKQKLTDFLSSVKGIGESIKQKVFDLLPQVVSKALGDILQHAGNIKAALKSASRTITKTLHYLKSDGMTMLASNRVGSYVIVSIRDQIKAAAVSSSVATLHSGGTILINALSAGVGASVTSIANAIISIFQFFVSLVNKWKMEKAYLAFKKKCTTYLVNIDSMSNERLESFFAEHIRTIPILAAYILCIPRYGSPYNFLQILDVSPPNDMKRISLSRGVRKLKSKLFDKPLDSDKVAHQKNILAAFEDLKLDAREFIKESPITLESKCPGVVEVLRAARGQMNFLPDSGLDGKKVAHALHQSKLNKLHPKLGKAHHVTARLDRLLRSDHWS